jgi:hypothetical protein
VALSKFYLQWFTDIKIATGELWRNATEMPWGQVKDPLGSLKGSHYPFPTFIRTVQECRDGSVDFGKRQEFIDHALSSRTNQRTPFTLEFFEYCI